MLNLHRLWLNRKYINIGFDFKISHLGGSDIEIAKSSLLGYNSCDIGKDLIPKDFSDCFGIIECKKRITLGEGQSFPHKVILPCFNLPLAVGLKQIIYNPDDNYQYYKNNKSNYESFDFIIINTPDKDLVLELTPAVENSYHHVFSKKLNYILKHCIYQQHFLY